MQLNTPAEIIEDIRNGKMVILMDDEDRENEGDLAKAAIYRDWETYTGCSALPRTYYRGNGGCDYHWGTGASGSHHLLR